MRRLGGALALAIVMFVAVFAQAAKSVWAGVYTPEQATRGADLYRTTCAECHGADLEGRETSPPLAGGVFGQRWDGATLKKLFERIEEMPEDAPADRLPPKQCIDVLAFLLSINKIPAGTTELVVDKDALAAIKYSSQRPK